jgi:outer membrane protein TolC
MDLAMTRLEVAGAVDDRAALLSERDEALAELRQLVALPVGTEITVVAAPETLTPIELAADDAALVRAALEARPELRARAARVAEAEAEVYLEKAEQWPWFSFVQVGYELDTDPEPDPAAFSFALGIELPLFDWNTDGIAAAKAEVARRQADEEATVREIAAAVEAAAARVRSTARRLATMREVLLPAAEESAHMIEQALAAGAVDPLQTTVIEEQRLRAQRRYLEALQEHREAVAALEAAIGGPLPSQR